MYRTSEKLLTTEEIPCMLSQQSQRLPAVTDGISDDS